MQAGQVIKTLNEHLELSSSKDAEVSCVIQLHIIPSLVTSAASAQAFIWPYAERLSQYMSGGCH